MKKILNLETIIGLRKTIETMINDTQSKIIANNPWLKSSKGNKVDVVSLYEKYDTLLEQLNIVKLAQDKGNRTRIKRGGVTNQQQVLTLGNLRKKQSMLEEMSSSKLTRRKGGQADAYEFQISKSEIDKKLDVVNAEITEIKKSMTEFNKSTTIKIVIFEELNLL